MKKIAVFGSTGSVGKNTLEVLEKHSDRFKVCLITGHSNRALLEAQIDRHQPEVVYATDESTFLHLTQNPKSAALEVYKNFNGLKEALIGLNVEMVVNGLPSFHGSSVSMTALECGIDLALANKESLLIHGKELLTTAQKNRANILPIDSEASAIHQCLLGEDSSDIDRIFLTASGGPIYQRKMDPSKVDVSDILNHPVWKMGPKISVDSATMMNKAFEAYEIHQLFQIELDKITVVLHPEAKVHSMVRFKDGQMKILASYPDMKIPIEHALFFPKRFVKENAGEPPFPDTWHFDAMDSNQFPCFQMAMKYLKKGGLFPTALVAVNDYFVGQFLENKHSFDSLCASIDRMMKNLSIPDEKSGADPYTFVKECQENCQMAHL